MNLENISKTIEELKSFEKELAIGYKNGIVKPPVHFSGGNERQLIGIFKKICPEDWVCTTYRNHYHALLKGIPKDWLKKEISEGRSMQIMSKDYKFVTSSIVGGILPIATGIAMGLKIKNQPRKVWVFVGDMAYETGIFHESAKYARRHDLPITFIIEDNGLSVTTPTQKVWGVSNSPGSIIKYSYKTEFPHQGVGKEVGF